MLPFFFFNDTHPINRLQKNTGCALVRIKTLKRLSLHLPCVWGWQSKTELLHQREDGHHIPHTHTSLYEPTEWDDKLNACLCQWGALPKLFHACLVMSDLKWSAHWLCPIEYMALSYFPYGNGSLTLSSPLSLRATVNDTLVPHRHVFADGRTPQSLPRIERLVDE